MSSSIRPLGDGLGVRHVQDDRLQERWGRHSCLPRADRNVCPTCQVDLAEHYKQTPNCQRTRRRWRASSIPIPPFASHPTTLAGPISSEFFRPSFPPFRQLAAPWAKSYDGRRGPIASSTRCFAAAAARARNPKTMVSHTFSTHTFSTQRMLPSIFAFPFYLVC